MAGTWRKKRAAGAAALMMAMLLAGWIAMPDQWVYAWRAAPIVRAIEAYRRRTGHLPDPSDTGLMQSLGFELLIDYRPDFLAIDPSNYRLRYDEGFDGPSWTYDSRADQWSKGYP
jgi:hypothetical protein